MRGFNAGGVQVAIDTAAITNAIREGMYGVRIAVDDVLLPNCVTIEK